MPAWAKGNRKHKRRHRAATLISSGSIPIERAWIKPPAASQAAEYIPDPASLPGSGPDHRGPGPHNCERMQLGRCRRVAARRNKPSCSAVSLVSRPLFPQSRCEQVARSSSRSFPRCCQVSQPFSSYRPTFSALNANRLTHQPFQLRQACEALRKAAGPAFPAVRPISRAFAPLQPWDTRFPAKRLRICSVRQYRIGLRACQKKPRNTKQ